MEQKSKLPLIISAVVVAVIAICLIVFFTTSKSAKIKKLEKFTTEIEENYQNYSASDLEKAQAKFDKIVAKVEKKELSGDEEKHVNELKSICKGYFAQAKARLILQDFKNAVEDAGDEVKDVINSLRGDE